MKKYFLPFHIICSICWVLRVNAQILTTSTIPIVLIQSQTEINDEPKITATLTIIDNGYKKINRITDLPAFKGRIGIEYRGSTSQWFPKKPYGMEMWNLQNEDLDTSLLGMPKESDWVLNATYNDKTLMRDLLTYDLGGTIMDYSPRGKYCELIVNGSYQGIYILMEKIKRDNKRVNISKLDNTIKSGDALTGGYIVKIDKETGGQSTMTWQSKYSAIPNFNKPTFFQLEYPTSTNVNIEQINYIKNHLNKVEDAIASPQFADPVNGWRKYIDEDELIDFIIMNELAKNGDGYRLSTYFYKDRDSKGGKIKMGPLWDFNLSFGNIDYCTGGSPEGLVITDFNTVCREDGWVVHFWWSKFLKDGKFYDKLKSKWNLLRQNQFSTNNIHLKIDSIQTYLGTEAINRNFIQWPVLGMYVWPNFYVGQTYSEEINFLKNWVMQRCNYLDIVWKENKVDTSTTNFEDVLQISPNPSQDIIQVYFVGQFKDGPYLVDSQGKRFDISAKTMQKSWELDIRNLIPGTYFVKILDKNDKIYSRAFVKL